MPVDPRPIVPVRLGVWVVCLLAGGFVVMSLSNHQSAMAATVNGLMALIVLASLLWAAARLWTIPVEQKPALPQVEDIDQVEEDIEVPDKSQWEGDFPEAIFKSLAEYEPAIVEAE